MSRVLVIPDLHLPFEHKKALYHCQKVADKEAVNKVICIGDIFDHHQMSRHTSEPDAYGAVQEYKLTCRRIKSWYKAFPKLDLVLGNHDEIPARQAKEVGIPKRFLKDLAAVYDMPSGWKIHKRFIFEDVLYLHSAGSGINGSMNKAKQMSMSVGAGHTHKHGGVIYFSNPLKLFFGMNVGCLIDKEAYAMRYSDSEPTLGAGVVYSSSEAYFRPLKLL